MFGSFQFAAASLAESKQITPTPASAVAGGIGDIQFGQGQLAQPNLYAPTPAAPVAASIGSFSFGQGSFAQSDALLPTADCELDATLGDLTCEATATSPAQSIGGGSGRRFVGIDLPPRRRSRRVSKAILEADLGALTLESQAVAPEEIALGDLALESKAVTWSLEQDEAEIEELLLVLGIIEPVLGILDPEPPPSLRITISAPAISASRRASEQTTARRTNRAQQKAS